MKPRQFYFRVFGTICIAIISFCFFIYPAFVSIKLAIAPSFRKPELNNYTLSMFYTVSKEYEHWANHYRKSKYAGSVATENVAGTEWPMFGSVFYLIIADDIKSDLASRDPKYLKRVTPQMMKSVEAAAAIVADTTTATWVQQIWGKDYLKKENVFYRMLLISGLAHYEHLSGKTTYRAILAEQTESLSAELSKAKYHLLDDYPGECYPNDILWSAAAILYADKILGTNHQLLANQVMHTFTSVSTTEFGIPPYMAEPDTGKMVERPRGCGNSGILIYAPVLDSKIAKQWYQNYEKYFWQDNGFCRGFREHSKTLNYSYSDVDSGPVIGGYGSVAAVFGIGAARANGRLDHSVPLTQEVIVCCYPTPFGLLIPKVMGWSLADSACLGETALLFSMTRKVQATGVVPFTGRTPLLVWVAFLIYFSLGLVLLYLEYRSWKKWLKKPEPSTSE
ncbi:MAG: hypothetical protein ACE14V_07045 [bacterium]